MSFAAVLATEKVAEVISSGSPPEFMHGPTFMGNPLACSIACASLDLLSENSPLPRIGEIEGILRRELAPAAALPQVADVRTLGAIGVIELHRSVDMATLQQRFVDEGVWVRPFGRLVYAMPPYIIKDQELSVREADPKRRVRTPAFRRLRVLSGRAVGFLPERTRRPRFRFPTLLPRRRCRTSIRQQNTPLRRAAAPPAERHGHGSGCRFPCSEDDSIRTP